MLFFVTIRTLGRVEVYQCVLKFDSLNSNVMMISVGLLSFVRYGRLKMPSFYVSLDFAFKSVYWNQ